MMDISDISRSIRKRIIGQEETLDVILGLVNRGLNGFRWPEQPLASILALGPTGTGKTETALMLAECLGLMPMRLDMSEFMTEESIWLLLGANQSESGRLGFYYDRWREQWSNGSDNKGLILFDEIEKANGKVLDIFLQLLSTGIVTCANNDRLDFRNFIVFATSNIGSRSLMESQSSDYDTISERALVEARQHLRPEVLARFDAVVAFNKIGKKHLLDIAELHTKGVLVTAQDMGIKLSCDHAVLSRIVADSDPESYGARDIRKAAMRILGDTVLSATGANGRDGTIKYNPEQRKCYLLTE